MATPPSHSPLSSASDEAAYRRSNELKLLGRYQRNLLFGGGALLSLILVLVGLRVGWTLVKDYIADGRYVFLTQKALLLVDVETKQAALRRAVINAETLWADQRRPSEFLLRQFSAERGRVRVQASAKADPQLVLAEVTPARPADSFIPYLGLAEELGYTSSANALQRTEPLIGYYYSPDRHFIAIWKPPTDFDPFAALGVGNTAGLIQRLATPLDGLNAPAVAARLHATRHITWLPVGRDPLTGELAFRLVQPAFDADRPFAVFVSSFPAAVFQRRLSEAVYDGEFLLLDRSGRVMLHSRHGLAVDPQLAQRLVASRLWEDGFTRLTEHYGAGVFSVSERLSETGWVLSYAYSWRIILAVLWPRLLVLIATVLGLVGLVWLFVIAFHRRVFMPVYLRSQRVFESESLNRTIIDTAPVGLSLLSAEDGSVLLQNTVMQGYERRSGGVPLHTRLLQAYRSAATASGDGSRRALVEHELAIEQQGVGEVHLLATVVQSKYQGREVLLCTFTDVTARQRTAQKLEEARRAADAANSAKSTFLATMSHEVRTPLNAILGHLELLARTQLADEQAKRLGIVQSASAVLLDVINDILDFSRVESGQMSLEALPFDLVAVLREVVAIFAPLAEAKGVALRVLPAAALAPRYIGDPTRLRQVLVNLVSNAIKFTSVGEVVLAARPVPAAQDGATVVLSVRDTGIGVDSADMAMLFEPYRQANISIARRFGGTGLGLPLCRRLVTLMGGRIEVESTPGVGSVFTVSLPLAQASSPTLAEAGLPQVDSEPDQAIGRLLVAEDHPVNRALLRDQLEWLGYRVDVVENGLAALHAFGEQRYDAVLTDLEMPQMDGYALAACLRDQQAGVPVIVLTAHVTADEHRRAFDAGVTDIVSKPITLGALDQVLRRHLGRKAASAASAAPISPLGEAMRELLGETTRQSLQAIEAAIAQDDAQTVLAQLHSIKGGFAMAGHVDVVEACSRLEEQVKREGVHGIEAQLPVLVQVVSQALEPPL